MLHRIGLLIFLWKVSIVAMAQVAWVNPIVKQGRLGSPLVETSPFVFLGKTYVLENNQHFWDVPGASPGQYFDKDEVRIRDLESKKIISVPLTNHGFGTVLVWKGRVYVFAGNYGKNKPWRNISEITMVSSADLKTWTAPITVLRAAPNEFFYNTAVCRGKDRFILLYETNDPAWTPFTFRYVESTDLKNWKEIPGAIYGKDKYVGGPALYFEGGWFYTLYLEALRNGYETRITRSKNLINWQDAPADRPFITFDSAHVNIPLLKPDIRESNASDVELCYYKGKTILYFTGSDQTTAGDLQWAKYNGSPRQLFECFFEDPLSDKDRSGVPDHIIAAPWPRPSVPQLAFQERQLGAFIHFGLATYAKAHMLEVPDAQLFNPEKMDARQWVRAARSFGARHIVLTVKHHNGFCLWPTKTTPYSVASSPWKSGQGDVVKEFVSACREQNILPGFYISGGDKHFGCVSSADPMGERKLEGNRDAYAQVFLEQLTELLSSYGEISYLWFDGAYDPFGWDVKSAQTLQPLGTGLGDKIFTLVKKWQPNSIVFGGTTPEVRWSGSEQGWAAYPLWNKVDPEDWAKNYISPESKGWIPVEANVFTRSNWFWAPDTDHTLKTTEQLADIYLESIGRGANLLINITPDTSGLIPEMETQRLAAFGKKIDDWFANPLSSKKEHTAAREIRLRLKGLKAIGLIEIEEDISKGQRISQYHVDALVEGKWKNIASGSTVGRKRIQMVGPLETNMVRLSWNGNEAERAVKKFEIYPRPGG